MAHTATASHTKALDYKIDLPQVKTIFLLQMSTFLTLDILAINLRAAAACDSN